MTVNEVEKQVLRLLDEVGASDYSDRMYKLIDEAQREIACTWGFIRKKMVLEAEAGVPILLPEDVYAVERAESVAGSADFTLEPTEDGTGAEIFFEQKGSYKVFYKAYPDSIGENDSSKSIQLAPEYDTALVCYTAALTQDNEYDKRAYQLFMERYNNSIATVQNAMQRTGKARVIIHGKSV